MDFNSEQAKSLVRTLSQIGGTLLASYGYGTAGQWETIGGVLLTLAATVWSMWSNRTAGIVAKAGNLSAVTAPIPVSDPALAVAANKAAGGTVAVAR